jgi:hypothetical protein
MKRVSLICFTLVLFAGMAPTIGAETILFTLLGDPNQNYTFARTDSPSGAAVTDPVGPYSGYLGSQIPQDLYGFLCIDYLKTANWNTTYSGFVYGVADPILGKTQAQVVEAAYLTTKLMELGGSQASTNTYQGPISFAIWQIMDPTAGDVPRAAAAQPYVQEAQASYLSGSISAANFPNVRIFVPDNTSIQGFMTATGPSVSPAAAATSGVPEPGTVVLIVIGLALLGIGRIRRAGRIKVPR